MARTAASTRSDSTNGKDPAKDLDAEIAALREDIASITSTLGTIAKQRTDKAQANIEHAGQKVVQRGEEAIGVVQDQFEVAEDEIKSMIRDKPITSVLVAAGIGYVISKVFRV